MELSLPPTSAPGLTKPSLEATKPRSYRVVRPTGVAAHEADDVALVDGVLEIHKDGWLTASYAPGQWNSLELVEQEQS